MQKSARQNSSSLIASGSRKERAKTNGARTRAFFTHCFGRISRNKEYAVLGMNHSAVRSRPYITRTAEPISIRFIPVRTALAKPNRARYVPRALGLAADSLTVEQTPSVLAS